MSDEIKGRILVAEDEERMMGLYKAIFRRSFGQYATHYTPSRKEAEKVLDEYKGDFNLVYSDCDMEEPGSGLKLHAHILEKYPGLGMRFVLASGDHNNELTAKEKGIPFVYKPFDMNHLISALEEVLKYGKAA